MIFFIHPHTRLPQHVGHSWEGSNPWFMSWSWENRWPWSDSRRWPYGHGR